MAALSTNVRQQLWRGLTRFWFGAPRSVAGITKTALQAAVNAADDWADTNAASYNSSALPATFRTNATANKGVSSRSSRWRVTMRPVSCAALGEVD